MTSPETVSVILPQLGFESDFRWKARLALMQKRPPERVFWHSELGSKTDLFAQNGTELSRSGTSADESTIRAPKAYLELMNAVLCHSDPERFHLLYEALWRLQDNLHLLQDRSSHLIARLENMAKSVRRDCHKMTAFVRFREVTDVANETQRPTSPRAFYAWFEPDHWIMERTGPFFANRFGDMNWVVETPKGCARFQEGALSFLNGVEQPVLPEDETGELWNTYFLNIFNPARLKVKAMQSEMPKKYWRNLPETALIPQMIARARSRSEKMQEDAATHPPVRAERIRAMMQQREDAELANTKQQITAGGLAALKHQASSCTRCPLHCNATQTVFGEGPSHAELMLVGEQPGDHEDLSGRPFVGPAGRLLNDVMGGIAMNRDEIYLTNAVKHFKFAPRGKRRIHKNPGRTEVSHCKWWLEAERAIVKPKAIVALGGIAALALTGRGDAIWKRRGSIERLGDGTPVLITIHPSAILRLAGAESQAARQHLQADLLLAETLLSGPADEQDLPTGT